MKYKCEFIPLTELLEFIVDNRGKTVPTAEKGIPLIATNCIKNTELYPVFEKIRYVSQEIYNTWFRSHPKPGDIIFVNKGTPGRVCLVPEPVNFCIAQDMMAFRVDEKKVYNKYLFAVLRSNEFQTKIKNFHVGTMIPHFKKGDLDNLLIPIPSYEIQKQIGDMYYLFSKKVELNNEINKTLEEIAQAFFKRWFVDFEFTNQEGKPYKSSGGEMVESEMGMIPNGWRILTVNELCDINKNSLNSKEKLDYINYLDTANLTENRIDTIQKLDTKNDKIPSRAKRKVQKDSILYSTVRPNQLHYGIVKEPVKNMIASTGFVVIDSKYDYLKNDFIYYWLIQRDNTDKMQAIAETSTSTYPSIKSNDIKKLKLVVPSENILGELSNQLNLFNKTIYEYEKESKKLTEIRDALLPKFMNGEIIVDDKNIN